MSSKTDKKKSKEKKSVKKEKKTKKPKTPTPEPEEAYEDDFEDYDDDFEDDEEQENEVIKTEELQPNTDNHNEESYESNIARRLSKAHITAQNFQKPAIKISQNLPEISFLPIDNRQYHSEEERKSIDQRGYERLQKLRGLISIESSKSTVFTDLSSNIFEALQSHALNKSHAFSQTGNDQKSEEVQTDARETESKETQYPHIESSSRRLVENEESVADRARFKKFFFAATQTISEILISDDKSAEEDETREKSTAKFSRGFNMFQLGVISKNCKCTCVIKGDAESFIAAFEIFESPAQDLRNKSLIVEYYVHKRRPPKRLFVVESVVTCMKLSASSSILYVCLTDGTLCAFDLSLTDAAFLDSLPWVDSPNDIALRRPSFDSSFLATTISDASPIVGLAINQTTSGEEITTIDSTGTVSYWIASRIDKNEINIQLTAVIRPHPTIKRQSTSFGISAFCVISKPSIRFFIGTDTGVLYSMYKSDTSNAIPKIFKTERDKYGEVGSMESSPFDNTILLVGFSSGTVSIYRTTQTSPLINLPSSSDRVSAVHWNLRNPCSFYSIHSGRMIHTWDLSHGVEPRTKDPRGDNAKTTAVLNSSTWKSDASSLSYMGFAMESGECEIHVLEVQHPKNPNLTIVEAINRCRSL